MNVLTTCSRAAFPFLGLLAVGCASASAQPDENASADLEQVSATWPEPCAGETLDDAAMLAFADAAPKTIGTYEILGRDRTCEAGACSAWKISRAMLTVRDSMMVNGKLQSWVSDTMKTGSSISLVRTKFGSTKLGFELAGGGLFECLPGTSAPTCYFVKGGQGEPSFELASSAFAFSGDHTWTSTTSPSGPIARAGTTYGNTARITKTCFELHAAANDGNHEAEYLVAGKLSF